MSEIKLKEYLTKARQLENDIYLVKSFINYYKTGIQETENQINKLENEIKHCEELDEKSGSMYPYNTFASCQYIIKNFRDDGDYYNQDSYIIILKAALKKRNMQMPIFCSKKDVLETAANLAITELNDIISKLKLHIDDYKNRISPLVEPLANGEMELQEIYNQDIIFPKYRTFIAINQISEYFDSGRCTELTGTNGAYNLFESELRQNLIISKLDNIINELEQIKENQYYTYLAVRDAQNAISNIKVSVTTNTYIDGVRY